MNMRVSFRLHTFACTYVVALAYVIFAPFAGAAFGNSDSTTTRFVNRVSHCDRLEESSTFLRDCGITYALGVANAIRLFSTPPTKVSLGICCNSLRGQDRSVQLVCNLQTTEDAIAVACVSGCVHAVSSQLTASMRDDTQCVQSVRADVGPLLLPMGLSLCAEGSGFDAVEFVDGNNLCYIQLTQVGAASAPECCQSCCAHSLGS